MSVHDELVRIFRVEAAERLMELANILTRQRNEPGNQDYLSSAKAVAHNLKGAALTVGAQVIAGPCEVFEEEFRAIGESNALPNAIQLDTWMQIALELREIVGNPDLTPIHIDFESAGIDVSAVCDARGMRDESGETDSAAVAPQYISVATTDLDEVYRIVKESARTQECVSSYLRQLCGLLRESGQGGESGVMASSISVADSLAAEVKELQKRIAEVKHVIDSMRGSLG